MRLPFVFLLWLFPFAVVSARADEVGPAGARAPVCENASPEARELLEFLYRVKGRHTLLGHHNFLGRLSHATAAITTATGRTPAVWGSDFGFADESHDIDNIAYRPQLLEETLRQDGLGSIITLTYHQAHPVLGEPCSFEAGVQGKLTPQQWRELLTPETELNKKWRAQMDRLAAYLKALESERVAVLFRPYHEMNGSWFWWGMEGRERESVQLWKMLFRHFNDRHKLKNLIWVWSPSNNTRHGLEEWYPGDEYVDVIAADIYPEKGETNPDAVYSQVLYQRLERIAKGRPLAIGEHALYPTPEILARQPNWTWMMGWVDLPQKQTPAAAVQTLYEADRTVTLEELPSLRNGPVLP